MDVLPLLWIGAAAIYTLFILSFLAIRRLTLHTHWLSLSQRTLVPPFLAPYRSLFHPLLRFPFLDILPALGTLSLPELALVVGHTLAVCGIFTLKLVYADKDDPKPDKIEKLGKDGIVVPPHSFQWKLALGLGPLAAALLAPVGLPIIRSPYVTLLLGIPWERRVVLHRLAARFFLVVATLHGVYVLVLDKFQHLRALIMWTGIVSTGLFWVVALTSLEPIRRKWFDFFFRSHFVFLLAILFGIIHAGGVAAGAIPLGLWALFALYRCYQIYTNTTTLVSARALPGNVVELVVEHPGLVCHPGQFVFLAEPVLGIELHAFSVASFAPPTTPTGAWPTWPFCPPLLPFPPGGMGRATFLIKAGALEEDPGQWTSRLFNLVSTLQKAGGVLPPRDALGIPQWQYNVLAARTLSTDADSGALTSGLVVRYEGFFGQFMIDPLRYSTLVLVSGGIGVTPNAALLDALLSSDPKWSIVGLNVTVHFVWVARGRAPFSTWLPDLLHRASSSPHVHLHLYDSASPSQPLLTNDGPKTYGALLDTQGAAPPAPVAPDEPDFCGSILPGRPDVPSLLSSLPSRAGVFACGPLPLVESTQSASRRHSHHFHKESFEL